MVLAWSGFHVAWVAPCPRKGDHRSAQRRSLSGAPPSTFRFRPPLLEAVRVFGTVFGASAEKLTDCFALGVALQTRDATDGKARAREQGAGGHQARLSIPNRKTRRNPSACYNASIDRHDASTRHIQPTGRMILHTTRRHVRDWLWSFLSTRPTFGNCPIRKAKSSGRERARRLWRCSSSVPWRHSPCDGARRLARPQPQRDSKGLVCLFSAQAGSGVAGPGVWLTVPVVVAAVIREL